MGRAGSRRIFATALCGLVLGGLAVVIAPSAYASCAATPAASPHRFTGTVIAVEDDGSLATVRVDDGRVVTVLGGPGAPERNMSSSIDRRYTVGRHYEFHPSNNKDPYQDNACTATHVVAEPQRAAPVQPSDDLVPAALSTDQSAAQTSYALLVGSVAALVVMAGGAVWLVRVKRMRRPVSPT